jgi:ribonuclease HI
MELTAALEAVRALDGPLVVVSDSRYVVNCFEQAWWVGWLSRGWMTSSQQPVKNRDLWEPFIDLVLDRRDVNFRWVKGHSGDPMNELVDQLAVAASIDRTSTPLEPNAGVRPIVARDAGAHDVVVADGRQHRRAED